ncbi:MAG: hypothetical protein LBE62_02365 [Azonexus sp.]|jgi:hypothetical protein|nr:hypothetical protein [Azonexus sp.]
MARLAPALLQDLFALRDQVAAAPHGSSSPLVQSFAERTGKSAATIYAWLRRHAGYDAGRKKRADAGKTALPEAALKFIASAKREAVRGNLKATLPTAVAMNMAQANGIAITVSESRVNSLMRVRRMDVKSQMAARSTGEMRSLHPNHLHQIDPSLCLLYYTPKGQAMIREEEWNKNKTIGLDRVKFKVWRYVRYDHASGSIDLRYFEAAGENQRSLFEFLLWTWGRQEGRLSYGVPQMLLWDKGSANTSAAIRNLLDALGVAHETHAVGHAWAKGGVEVSNNIVETHFESRLRFEPVESVAELNASAERWARDYNANRIPHVDCRLTRASGEAFIRDDLWNTILQHPGALVALPPEKVCQWFLAGQEQTRKVKNRHITFAHPEIGKTARYDLSPWAEFIGNGQTLRVTPLLLQQGALRIEIERLGAEPLKVQVAPVSEFDAYGRPLAAPVAGEEYKRGPLTQPEIAANALAAAAWGEGVSAEGAEEKRAQQARPFGHMNDGKGLVAHSYLGQTELPPRLLPEAAEVETAAVAAMRRDAPAVQIMLTVPEAVRSIKERLSDAAPADLYRQISAAFPNGHVPLAWADQWGALPPATGTHDGEPGLRRVK